MDDQDKFEVKFIGRTEPDTWYTCELGPVGIDAVAYTAGGETVLEAVANAWIPGERISWLNNAASVRMLGGRSPYSSLPYLTTGEKK